MGKRYLGAPGEGVRVTKGRIDPRKIMLIPETLGLGEKITPDNPEAQPVTYSERAAHTLRIKLWKMKHSKALAGLLDFIFDMPQKRTTNPITDMILTKDKVILVCCNGSPIIDSIFGTEWEILRCLTTMLIHVGATPEETDTMSYLLATKIRSNTSFTPPPGAVISSDLIPKPALVDPAGNPVDASNEPVRKLPTVDDLKEMVTGGEGKVLGPDPDQPAAGGPHEETAPGDFSQA